MTFTAWPIAINHAQTFYYFKKVPNVKSYQKIKIFVDDGK